MLLGTSARPVGRRLLGASRTNFFSLHLVQQRTYARRIYITLRVYDSSLKLKLINIILSLVIVITFTTLLRLISLSAQERESEPLRALALRGAMPMVEALKARDAHRARPAGARRQVRRTRSCRATCTFSFIAIVACAWPLASGQDVHCPPSRIRMRVAGARRRRCT